MLLSPLFRAGRSWVYVHLCTKNTYALGPRGLERKKNGFFGLPEVDFRLQGGFDVGDRLPYRPSWPLEGS